MLKKINLYQAISKNRKPVERKKNSREWRGMYFKKRFLSHEKI
jgi:hypothetical protein